MHKRSESNTSPKRVHQHDKRSESKDISKANLFTNICVLLCLDKWCFVSEGILLFKIPHICIYSVCVFKMSYIFEKPKRCTILWYYSGYKLALCIDYTPLILSIPRSGVHSLNWLLLKINLFYLFISHSHIFIYQGYYVKVTLKYSGYQRPPLLTEISRDYGNGIDK